MQPNQLDALKSALDPKALTESRKAKKDEKSLQESTQEGQDKDHVVVSLDEAQDAKIVEARKTPPSARVGQIAEACDGTRDPDLTKL